MGVDVGINRDGKLIREVGLTKGMGGGGGGKRAMNNTFSDQKYLLEQVFD